MKSMRYLSTGASVFALAAIASFSTSATAKTFYPYKFGATRMDLNRAPGHIGPHEGPYVAKKEATSGSWSDLTGTLPFANGPWGQLLMTDGTVIVMDYCTSPAQWYRLTPDSKGNYVDGTWAKTATMPSGYSPLFFAEQVLQDGRVMIQGGEYNDCSQDWTNKGALFDPVKNSWSTVSPPSGWSTIGDAESVMLPNATYMVANCCDSPGESATAAINGTTVTWTTAATWSCSGNPCNDEEAFNSIPGGELLAVDVWNLPGNKDDYWIWKSGTWTDEGTLPNLLTTTSSRELGPAPITWQGSSKSGTLVQFGADPATGYNDLYNISTGKWSAGPVIKYNGTIYTCSDAPAATLPDGNILVDMSPGTFSTPTHFWEVAISLKGVMTATKVNDPKEAPNTSSFEGDLLVLPTGQVMWSNSQASPKEIALYTPRGKALSTWLPVVSSVSTTLTVGSTGNAISGTKFNGFSSGGAYGDDAQNFTNWPIVRITNGSTGNVCYGRSYNFSTMGVWTSGTTNAEFDIPSSCETGASTLQVIVNGIASAGTSVTLKS